MTPRDKILDLIDAKHEKQENKFFPEECKYRKGIQYRKIEILQTIDNRNSIDLKCEHNSSTFSQNVCVWCLHVFCKECVNNWEKCTNCGKSEYCIPCWMKLWKMCHSKRCVNEMCQTCTGHRHFNTIGSNIYFHPFKETRCIFCKKIHCNECMKKEGKINNKNDLWSCQSCIDDGEDVNTVKF